MIKELLLATNNLHKIQEIQLFFTELSFPQKRESVKKSKVLDSRFRGNDKKESGNDPFKIISQAELNIPPIAEIGTTFLDNALLKAKYVASYTDLPVVADDSGLEIDALNGLPGVYSARYAGESATDLENIQKVLKEMYNIPESQRLARFRCVLVYLDHQIKEQVVCEGTWEGSILFEPRTETGFGYEPIFWVPTHRCSAAELPRSIKNQISHRGEALRKLIEQLSVL